MDDSLIPFGLTNDGGRLVDVADVPRGKQCGCVCPSCKTPLIARHGDVKEWHFAHASRAVYSETQKDCEYSFFVSVRMMARQMLSEMSEIRLPALYCRLDEDVPELLDSVTRNYPVTSSQKVTVADFCPEKRFSGVLVDLVGRVGDYELAIYFTHPGRPIPTELRSPLSIRSGVVEISLDKFSESFRDYRKLGKSYEQALLDYLTKDMSVKAWIYHPRYAEVKKAAQKDMRAEIQAMIRRRGVTSVSDNSVFQKKQRVVYKCLMCTVCWDGVEPGGSVCPRCKSLLYRTIERVCQS